MLPVLELACARCGRPHDEQALVCALCGNLLRREKTSIASATSSDSGASVPEEVPDSAEARRARLEPWLYLALGLVTAPILARTPLLQYMAWFLAALVHEMGHAAFAWLCGMPAVPAISLGGEAAAVHGEPSLLLALALAAAIVATLWSQLAGRARAIALALFACVYPAVAFTGARDVLHLLAGHGGELAFATLCLWKTLDGGFTDSRLERALYGTVGWTLLGQNIGLCWGLMHSAVVRSEYRSNGSFGLTNDYLRVADILSWSLPAVALGMLVVGLLVLPAALALWRLSSRTRAAKA